MIVQDTIEDIIKYCEQLISNIKRHQNIASYQAGVKNNLGSGGGSGWDMVQSISYGSTQQNISFFVKFTPNNSVRPLSSIDINFSLMSGVYDYSYMVTVASSASVSSNFIEYVVTLPFLPFFTGTFYIKTNAGSLDSGAVSYTVVTV